MLLYRLSMGAAVNLQSNISRVLSDQPCVALRSTRTERHGGTAVLRYNPDCHPVKPRVGTTCNSGTHTVLSLVFLGGVRRLELAPCNTHSPWFQLFANKSKMPGHRRSYCQTGPVFQTKMNTTLAWRAQKAMVEPVL